MTETFVKLIRSENKKAEWLALHEPLAFALLSIIALRACRTLNHPDGLKIGEAFVGDWQNSGFSRQNYRTALKILISYRFLEIVETNRNRKKSTTGLTTKGTKVRLLNSVIYDINPETPNHSSNQALTTAQPLPNHEQEDKECKESKENAAAANSFAQDEKKSEIYFCRKKQAFVGITTADYQAWQKYYPKLDIVAELGFAKVKLQTHPKYKEYTANRQFIENWLKIAQDQLKHHEQYQGSTPMQKNAPEPNNEVFESDPFIEEVIKKRKYE